MPKFRIHIEKVQLEKKLQLMLERSKNMRPAYQEIGKLMWASILKNFDVGGRPAWKPLAISTLVGWVGSPKTPHRKTWFTKKGRITIATARRITSRRPLMDTGALRRSVRASATSNRALLQAGGGAVPYAAVHQFGGKPHVIIPNKKKALYWEGAAHPVKRVNHPGVPARPYMVMQPEDRLAIRGVFKRHLLAEKAD
jgi:phage gpG-like protein